MYLGVDSGGTKTAFALVDDSGRVLATHEEVGGYYLEIGLDATGGMLHKGVLVTLCKAGLTLASIRFAFFGLPAHGEDSALVSALDALPSAFLPKDVYRCGNDMVCGWAGSLACQDGINVVAGTGSIAYGEYQGRSARAGGWGELFSDEGSAYWIAREGLTLFSRMSDGRAAKGPLHALARAHFGLVSDLDLCATINGQEGSRRCQLAQLAKLVFDAAMAGDTAARAIFRAAAVELFQLVEATRFALQVPAGERLPVSYSGSVFHGAGALVREPFAMALEASSSRYILTAPQFSPVVGAALYAAKCAHAPFEGVALANLAAQTAQQEWP